MNDGFWCVVDSKNIYRNYVEVIGGEVQGYTMQLNETLVCIDPPVMRTHAGTSGFVRSRWDGASWGEGATPEEIAAWEKEHPAPPSLPPSPIELLTAENHLLKAQMQAQSGRNDFIEDCIAEMAMQIYNT